jgi:hypothetical protein
MRDMAGISLDTANAKLTTWLDAEDKVASGQAYQIGNRSMKRADLKEIRDSIIFWNGVVTRLTRSGGRNGIQLTGVVPRG